MNTPAPIHLSSLTVAPPGSAEEKVNALIAELDYLNPNPPATISADTVGIERTFGQLWELVGGSLNGHRPALPPETIITLRPYIDPSGLTRAKVNRTQFPNTIFINVAHVRDTELIARLRLAYSDAAKGVVLRGECPPEQLFAFHAYESLDSWSGARTTYLQTLEEELLHLLSGAMDISKVTNIARLKKDGGADPAVQALLSKTNKEGVDARNRPEGETALERFHRRTRYLADDWELIARIGKLCRAVGFIPQTPQEVHRFARTRMPLLLGGQRELQKRQTTIWDTSRYQKGGHYFRALAEVNTVILMLYPRGASRQFKRVMLPYYFGIVGLLHGDSGAMTRMGFDGVQIPLKGKRSGARLRIRTVWRPRGKKGPVPELDSTPE